MIVLWTKRYTVLLFLTLFWSPVFLQDNESSTISSSIVSNKTTIMLTENFNNNKTEHEEIRFQIPKDCSQREKLKTQPINNGNSRLKKCCPIGESLVTVQENMSQQMCDSSQNSFEPNVIKAVLYDNCIEDEEIILSLPFEIRNPCNDSLYYNSDEDIFYVIQDGSLLILDEFANDTYTVENEYCMDVDKSGKTYAFVCITSIDEHIKRNNIILIAILMLISIPCLVLVSYINVVIPELRTVHGLSVGSMSLCLAIGYFMHSFVYILDIKLEFFGYAIQLFILAYFFWYLCICINTAINIWFIVPLMKQIRNSVRFVTLAFYFLMSLGGSLLFVLLTAQKGFLGMPSYFLQGLTESIRESQRYFIPPVTGILLGCFMILVACFFGFQRIKKMGLFSKQDEGFYVIINADFDLQKYEEVKTDAKCISLMGVITITTWMLEVVTFYSPGPAAYLILLDMINGLQGVFIFIIFLLDRGRRTVVMRWWYDHGSHNIEKIELSAENE